MEGRIGPGTRIVEERLARDLGMSRTPLREAIQRLRRDGLIVGVGRETRVIEISPKTIRELHLLRATLETLAYQSAARSIAERDVADLQQLITDMRTAGSHQMLGLDYEFHRRLCKLSGLDRLYDAWHDQQFLFRLWLNVVGAAHEDAAYLADSHAALLTAVTSGDPHAIALEVTRHVYGVGSPMAGERQLWVEDRAIMLGENPSAVRSNGSAVR
jgi:DNA-binding GntR family transcriptional regulator